MKSRKLLCATLALAMTVSTFVGCQGPSPAAGSEPATSGSTSSTAGTADGPLTKYAEPVAMTTARSVDAAAKFDTNDPERKSYAENRWITAYKQKLNIDLKYKWIATDGTANESKWSTAIASNDLPDMGMVSDTVYQQLLDSGLVADMSETFNKYASDYLKTLITNEMKKYLTFDGKLMGLPFPSKGYHGPSVLFIRKDWLDKVKLQTPKTIDDVINIARSFQKAKLGGKDTIGILFGTNDGGDGSWYGFMNAYGAYKDIVLEKNGELVSSNTLPEMEKALLSMQSLYKEGLINKDIAVVKDETAGKYIANGQVGVWYGMGWAPALAGITGLYQNDKNADIISVYPPSVSETAVPIQNNIPVPGKCFVNAKCKNPEAAVKLLNLTAQLDKDDFKNYGTDSDGYNWFKLLPWGDRLASALGDLQVADEVRQTLITGKDCTTTEDNKLRYQLYQQDLKAGNPKYPLLYGMKEKDGTYKEGSYVILFDAYKKNLLIGTVYHGLPTKTDALKGQVLSDNLHAAMLKVIMGSDISVYQKAVNDWKTNGGDQIIKEQNEWYQENSK